MTTIGNSTVTVTLAPADPDVTLIGTIDAIGDAGRYVIQTGTTTALESFYAAVFGPAAGKFKLQNTGTIISNGVGLDFGIVLGKAGKIINSGEIIGGDGIAILGTAGGGYIKNTGEIYATFDTGVYLQGKGTVVNKKVIAASFSGIVLGGGGSVSNAATGYIYSGYLNGVDARAKASVANAGIINGDAGGIHVDAAGTVNNTGLIIERYVTATIAADAGIYIAAGGAVTNTGTIEGGNAIRIGAGVKTSIDNSGDLVATSTIDNNTGAAYGFLNFGVGVYSRSNATITNTGTIAASHVGIVVENAVGTVTNAGLITAAAGYGIYLHGGGDVFNTGTIDGYSQGIFLDNTAATSADTITNAGVIDAISKPQVETFSGGATFTAISTAIFMLGGGTIENLAGGTIEASLGIGIDLDAVTIKHAGKLEAPLPAGILNAGLVQAQYGIDFYGLGAVTNTGKIIAVDTGIEITNALASIANSGLIEATATTFSYADVTSAAAAVLMTTGGSLTNTAKGTIEAFHGDGIELLAGGFVSNKGTIIGGHVITAGTTAIAVAAIYGAGAIGATIDNSGLIYAISQAGTAYGIKLNGANAAITNAAPGSITVTDGGFGIGIVFTGANAYLNNCGLIRGVEGVSLASGALYNSGSIIGNDNDGIAATGPVILYNYAGALISGGETGLALTTANVTNAGTIIGGIAETSGTIFNTGSIGAGGDGIAITGTSAVYNYGLINAGQTAISATAGYIYNAGKITAATGIALAGPGEAINAATGSIKAAAAIVLGAAATFHNDGVITGGNTAAVLSSGAALFNNGQFTGGIIAETSSYVYNSGTIRERAGNTISITGQLGGAGTIELGTGPATLDGAVTGQHPAFTGTAETLSLGDPANFAGTIDNFAIGDTIDLTSLSDSRIVSHTFAAGVFTITATSGTYTMSFASPSNFKNETFSLFADDFGTGITLASITAAAPSLAAAGFLTQEWRQAAAISPLITLHA